jgi:ribose transport system permease protein
MPSRDNSIGKISVFKKIDWSKYIVYIAFVVVFLFFAIWIGGSGFLEIGNILNIIRQTAMITIMSVAMTFVIGSAEIDLSIGSIEAVSALIAALILRSTSNIFLAVLAGVAIGVVCGALNGFLLTKFAVPSFLATLGTMGIIRGIAMWMTGMAAIPITDDTFNFVFGVGNIGGWLPVLLIWTIIFVVVGYFLLNRMPFGKKVLAVGGNITAARFTGINADKIKVIAFTMSGAFAAFAGILTAGRMQAGRYTFGQGDEMSCITAVVLGGTAMSGGVGSVIGTLIGSLLMGMISNGLILGGLSSSGQTIVRGIILIAAVALSNVTQKQKK